MLINQSVLNLLNILVFHHVKQIVKQVVYQKADFAVCLLDNVTLCGQPQSCDLAVCSLDSVTLCDSS